MPCHSREDRTEGSTGCCQSPAGAGTFPVPSPYRGHAHADLTHGASPPTCLQACDRRGRTPVLDMTGDEPAASLPTQRPASAMTSLPTRRPPQAGSMDLEDIRGRPAAAIPGSDLQGSRPAGGSSMQQGSRPGGTGLNTLAIQGSMSASVARSSQGKGRVSGKEC